MSGFDVEEYVRWVMSDEYDVGSDPLLCTCLSCSIMHEDDFESDPAGWRAAQVAAAREE